MLIVKRQIVEIVSEACISLVLCQKLQMFADYYHHYHSYLFHESHKNNLPPNKVTNKVDDKNNVKKKNSQKLATR